MAKPKPTKEQLLNERDATMEHCVKVTDIMDGIANQIRVRGRKHDRSKFTDNELPYFAVAADLKTAKYDSKEYHAGRLALGPALTHHYEHNRHHPEHHGEDGIQAMNYVDMIEMMSDWLASGQRHDSTHNIFDSINKNRMRFRVHHGMARQMWLTAMDVFGEEPEEGCEMCIIKACPACGQWQDPQHKECQNCTCEHMYVV